MEAIYHEYYVSHEVAKLLKEVGFDWEVRSLYNEQDEFVFSQYSDWNNVTICKSAPTLAVAQKWLREVKGIWYEVTICFVMEDALIKTKYHVQCISTDYNNLEMVDCHNIETDTPEKALEAGIQKCLTILLKEKKK